MVKVDKNCFASICFIIYQIMYDLVNYRQCARWRSIGSEKRTIFPEFGKEINVFRQTDCLIWLVVKVYATASSSICIVQHDYCMIIAHSRAAAVSIAARYRFGVFTRLTIAWKTSIFVTRNSQKDSKSLLLHSNLVYNQSIKIGLI